MARTWEQKAYWLVVVDGVPQVYLTKDTAFEVGRKAKTFVYRQDVLSGTTSIVLDSSGTENRPGEILV